MTAGKFTSDATVSIGDSPVAMKMTEVMLEGSSVEFTIMTDPDSFKAAGETITYNYKIKNISNGPLNGIGINDPLVGGDVCTGVNLWPGVTVTCTQLYTVSADDVAAKMIDSTASAVADGIPATQQSHIVLLDEAPPAQSGSISYVGPTFRGDRACQRPTQSAAYRIVNGNYPNGDLLRAVVVDPDDDDRVLCEFESIAVEAQCTAVYAISDEEHLQTGKTIRAELKADDISLGIETHYWAPGCYEVLTE